MDIKPQDMKRFVEGIASEDVDEMAVPSFTHWNPAIRWLVNKRITTAQKLCLEQPFETVLDYGTGTGVMLPFLSRHARQVIAADQHIGPATRFSQFANLSNIELYEVRTAPIPVDDNSLDLIVSLEVLEHIKELDTVIQEFKRVLKPGGRLVVSSPTENLLYRTGRLIAGFRKRATYHDWNAAQVNAKVLSYFPRIRHKLLFPVLNFYDFSVFQKPNNS